MKLNLLNICVTAIVLGTSTLQRAEAGTSAYVIGGLLSGTLESCLKDMKTAADKTGFTENQETLISSNKKSGTFHADGKDSPLHFTAECDPAGGTYAMAVSGIDNDKTHEYYLKVYEALPKK